MNIKHLEYIIKIFETGSVNKAAEELYMAQSSLSNIVRTMEEEVGYKLFDRTNKGVRPTAAASHFIQHATEIVKQYEELEQYNEVADIDDSMNISCCPSSLLSVSFAKFIRENHSSGGSDIFREGSIQECIQNLLQYRCRMAIFYITASERQKYQLLAKQYQTHSECLIKDARIVAVMSENHPLAKKSEIFMKDLVEQHFVTYEGAAYQNILEIVGLSQSGKIFLTNNRSVFNDAICVGDYVSVSMMFDLETLHQLKCVCRPIEDYYDNCEVYLWTLKNYQLSEREEKFLAYYKEQFAITTDMM